MSDVSRKSSLRWDSNECMITLLEFDLRVTTYVQGDEATNKLKDNQYSSHPLMVISRPKPFYVLSLYGIGKF